MTLPLHPAHRGQEELIRELRQEEARLAGIDEQQRHARQRVEALKAELFSKRRSSMLTGIRSRRRRSSP